MIIVDNFVQDSQFLSELRDDVHWSENKSYFWFDKNSTSESPWLKLTRKIWIFASNFHDIGEYEGYEIWSQVIQNRQLDWHVDKDEYLWNTHQKIVSPILGSIWYAHTLEVKGGFLETINKNGSQLIEPVPNRLIIHDATQQHKVHMCTSGTRKSFLSNLWRHKPHDENFNYSSRY